MGCVLVEPVVNRLETELAGQLVVLRVDVNSDAGRELTAQTGNLATPAFIFYDASGVEQWRQIGSLDEQRLKSSIP